MYPILFGEGIWALPSYFTMVMLGFFICSIILRQEAIRTSWDSVKIVDLCFAMVVASIVGARLAHVLFDGFFMDYVWLCLDPTQLAQTLPSGNSCLESSQCVAAQNAGYNIGALCIEGKCLPERDCLRPFMFWAGGLTYYGGLILALVTAAFLAKRWKWSFLKLTDLAAPVIALGLAFGRLGCFLSGCCFGKITDVPWAVQFPIYSDAWKHHRDIAHDALIAQHAQTGEWLSLPVHPTQLYEMGGALVIFAILWTTRKKITYVGQKIAFFLITYAILRFVIEIWRDDERGGYLLSTSQWISILMFAVGLLIVWHGRRKQSIY